MPLIIGLLKCFCLSKELTVLWSLYIGVMENRRYYYGMTLLYYWQWTHIDMLYQYDIG